MMENEKVTLETEVHTVLSVVRDIDAGARPHSFKSTNFVSPTTCAFCNKSIWGLAGGKGFVCTGTITYTRLI
jgi:formin-binding protein 1